MSIMGSLDSLVNLQLDLSERVYKARQNFKKSPKDRITKVYLDTRLETLEQTWNGFRAGHKDLLQQIEPNLLKQTSYVTDEVYDDTEEEYTDYKCELKGMLASFTSDVSASPSNSFNLCPGSSKTKCNSVKLPKISIPNFSGKYTEWTTFRDLFLSMIHNNEELDNVQKLQYLKGYLTGEAEQLIRYIPVTESNYSRCWSQLEERYNNKKYLSHCILKRLLSQKNATSESASFLKEFIDTSSDCLNALSNLGIDVSSWDIIIIHLLSSKLDAESRKQWELNVTANVTSDALPTFAQFREYLTGRYRALEFIDQKSTNNHSGSYVRSSSSQFNSPKVLHVTGEFKIPCEFCGEEHKLCFCKGFARLGYEKRYEFVNNNKMCFNCLGQNHSVRFCQKTTNCQICKRRHHSLLHPKGNLSSTGPSGNVLQKEAAVSLDTVGARGVSNVSADDTPLTNHMACYTKKKTDKQVLLATALVKVEDKSGVQQTVRALLDQGSQASFVTEATVQRLGLKKLLVNERISGLGGDGSKLTTKYTVLLKMQPRLKPNHEIIVRAYVLNEVTTYLPKTIRPEWINAQQLQLADPAFDSSKGIDILLGAEVYCKILKEGVLRDPAGNLVAQCTALGWILSGQVNVKEEEEITVLHTYVKGNKTIEQESEPNLHCKKTRSEEDPQCHNIVPRTHSVGERRYLENHPFPSCKNSHSCKIAFNKISNLRRKSAMGYSGICTTPRCKILEKSWRNIAQPEKNLGEA